MILIFKLLVLFLIVFTVKGIQIVSNEEIEILQNKLCDTNISKELKDKLIDCMEENLPFVFLEAMDSCIYEVIPNAYTREEIQKSLCNDDSITKVHNCMQRKEKDFADTLPKQEMDEKFKIYKTCVDSAANKSDRSE